MQALNDNASGATFLPMFIEYLLDSNVADPAATLVRDPPIPDPVEAAAAPKTPTRTMQKGMDLPCVKVIPHLN